MKSSLTKPFLFLFFFLFLFSLSTASAIEIGYGGPTVYTTDVDFSSDVYIIHNDTELFHNNLTGLQGGTYGKQRIYVNTRSC